MSTSGKPFALAGRAAILVLLTISPQVVHAQGGGPGLGFWSRDLSRAERAAVPDGQPLGTLVARYTRGAPRRGPDSSLWTASSRWTVGRCIAMTVSAWGARSPATPSISPCGEVRSPPPWRWWSRSGFRIWRLPATRGWLRLHRPVGDPGREGRSPPTRLSGCTRAAPGLRSSSRPRVHQARRSYGWRQGRNPADPETGIARPAAGSATAGPPSASGRPGLGARGGAAGNARRAASLRAASYREGLLPPAVGLRATYSGRLWRTATASRRRRFPERRLRTREAC